MFATSPRGEVVEAAEVVDVVGVTVDVVVVVWGVVAEVSVFGRGVEVLVTSWRAAVPLVARCGSG